MSTGFSLSTIKRKLQNKDKFFKLLLTLLFLLFLGGFIYRSTISMRQVPFNEFDEAHRAENAKEMKNYKSFFVPLTGSEFDRVITLRIPFKDAPLAFLYYHLERPPLVYLLMVGSISMFGSVEWAYRLPSFFLGLLSLFVFLFFCFKFIGKKAIIPIGIGFLCLVTSTDLWLSSQYAQLDTGLTTFLFLALLCLIYYCEIKNRNFLIASGISFGLAILSKGQPAVIFLIPLLYLLITRKLKIKELLYFALFAVLIVSPWVIFTGIKFGFINFFKVFLNFAVVSATQLDIYHKAPFFWYVRWWWVTLRPGWTLFLALVLTDLFNKRLDWKKRTLLVYIVGSLIFLSVPTNKLWWYALPLIPATCYYICLAIVDLFKKKNSLINLSLVLLITSRPPISSLTNTLSVFYGVILTLVSLYILDVLRIDFNPQIIRKRFQFLLNQKNIFLFATSFSLISFFVKFPKIIPYDWNIKPVASHFSDIKGNKCLWISDLPPESILFYSNAGEAHLWEASSEPFGICDNYLITTRRVRGGEVIFRQNNMKLIKFDKKVNLL